MNIKNIHQLKAKTVIGKEISLSDYEGKVILIANTASKCMLTSQYAGLEKLYSDYKDQGFEVLVFPCNQFMRQEPGEPEEIMEFCQLYYDITMQMMEKVNVNGDDAHPVFKWLKSQKSGVFNQDIKWNFSKFLINKEGQVIQRYSPFTKPEKLIPDIEELLKA